MKAIRLVHLVNGTLLLVLLGGSLWVYPALPEQIPRHFGPGGIAYWDTTLFRWFLLPVIAIPCMALLYVPAWRMEVPEALQAFSVSRRGKYEQLSPAQKQDVARVLRGGMYGMATLLLVIFGAGQVEIYLVATTSATGGPRIVTWATWTSIVVLLFFPVGLAWWTVRRIRRLSEQAD